MNTKAITALLETARQQIEMTQAHDEAGAKHRQDLSNTLAKLGSLVSVLTDQNIIDTQIFTGTHLNHARTLLEDFKEALAPTIRQGADPGTETYKPGVGVPPKYHHENYQRVPYDPEVGLQKGFDKVDVSATMSTPPAKRVD